MDYIELLMPYPTIGSGKMKNQLVSMNNWSRLHWAVKSKIKNRIKDFVKNWVIPEAESKYESLELEFQVIRHCNRKFDVINTSVICKLFEDSLTELGYVDDDCRNKIILMPTKYDFNLKETMFRIRITPKRV
jgi:hypothetical protein